MNYKFYASVDEIGDNDNIQMLYVNGNTTDIKKVLELIKGRGILLISDHVDFDDSMVNFIIVNKKLDFTLNLPRIEQEGIEVGEGVINLATPHK